MQTRRQGNMFSKNVEKSERKKMIELPGWDSNPQCLCQRSYPLNQLRYE